MKFEVIYIILSAIELTVCCLWYFLYNREQKKLRKKYTQSSDKIKASHLVLIRKVPYYLNWEVPLQRTIFGPANTLVFCRRSASKMENK